MVLALRGSHTLLSFSQPASPKDWVTQHSCNPFPQMHPSLVLCSPHHFAKPCMEWLPVRHQVRVLSASVLGHSCLLSGKSRLTWRLGMLPSCSTFNCSFFFSPSSSNPQELAGPWRTALCPPLPSAPTHPLLLQPCVRFHVRIFPSASHSRFLQKKKKFPYLFSKSFLDVMSTPPIQTRTTLHSVQHFLPGVVWSPSRLTSVVTETVVCCGTFKGWSWKHLLCRLRSISQEWYLQMGWFGFPFPTSPHAWLSSSTFYTTARSIPDAST